MLGLGCGNAYTATAAAAVVMRGGCARSAIPRDIGRKFVTGGGTGQSPAAETKSEPPGNCPLSERRNAAGSRDFEYAGMRGRAAERTTLCIRPTMKPQPAFLAGVMYHY